MELKAILKFNKKFTIFLILTHVREDYIFNFNVSWIPPEFGTSAPALNSGKKSPKQI